MAGACIVLGMLSAGSSFGAPVHVSLCVRAPVDACIPTQFCDMRGIMLRRHRVGGNIKN